MADIYEAVNSVSIEYNGFPVVLRKGTTVREGHPLLAQHPTLFKLLVPTFEHTPEPEPEPEPEPVKAAPPAPKPALKAKPMPVAAKAKVDDDKE